MSSLPWPSRAVTPPIFSDLILDLGKFKVILDIERKGWLEKAQELQAQTKRAGLAMRDGGEVAAWLDTDGRPFECFSRVNGKISSGSHTQERRACIRCDGAEVWINSDGQVVEE